MPLNLVVAATAEPFPDTTLPVRQLRLTGTSHDSWLTTIAIPAARERAEQATQRQLIMATWELVLDRFPVIEGESVLELPKPPLQSVSWIKYVDTSGVLQTWSAAEYDVQTVAGPRCRRGRIAPKWGYSWPSIRDQIGAVTVRFVAGYGPDGTTVPPRLKLAMLEDIGGMFKFREDLEAGTVVEIPNGARAVYRAYRSEAAYPLDGCH